MGRAINMENDVEVLKREVQQLKTAFSGLADTVETLQNTAPAKKNIDLHKETDTRNVRAEGTKPTKKKKINKVVEEAEA